MVESDLFLTNCCLDWYQYLEVNVVPVFRYTINIPTSNYMLVYCAASINEHVKFLANYVAIDCTKLMFKFFLLIGTHPIKLVLAVRGDVLNKVCHFAISA